MLITRSRALDICGVALIAILIVGCEQKQDASKVPDAEAIQKVAQAILAAPDKKAAAINRQESRAAWAQVEESLQAFQSELMTVSLGQVSLAGGAEASGQSVQDQARAMTVRREHALQQLIDALQAVKTRYQNADSGPVSANPEWREQLAAPALAKVDSILADVLTWRGKSPPEQLESARALQDRIGPGSLSLVQGNDEAPTITTRTEHR